MTLALSLYNFSDLRFCQPNPPGPPRYSAEDMFNVSSVGPHAKAAYVATMEAYPSLKDESRRGLGLGRRHERARNRVPWSEIVAGEFPSLQGEKSGVATRTLNTTYNTMPYLANG